ncbi:MAG: MBL fold metallo-hydrolase [Patescibacteria group bacterium]
MKITWHGQSCFQITSQRSKDENVSVIIDPFDKEIGLKAIKAEADIVLVSHDHEDHNNVKAVSGNPFIINGPGEYEIKEVFVEGIEAFHDNERGKEKGKVTIYIIETEGIKVCHLSDLGQNELTADQVDAIGLVDILLIPIGGQYTISAKEAVKIMSQIEPKIIIPMHYALPNLKYKLDKLEDFLNILGIKSIEPEAVLSIKKKDISEEEAKIIILSAK